MNEEANKEEIEGIGVKGSTTSDIVYVSAPRSMIVPIQ